MKISISMVLSFINYGIILFWALWFLMVTGSDLVNFFQELKILSTNIAYTSDNYKLVSHCFSVYGIESARVIQVVFFLLIFWAFSSSILFFVSLFYMKSIMPYFAFLFSFSMTAFFILCDEFFIQYNLEHGHQIRLMFQMGSLLLFVKIAELLEKKYYYS